MLHSKQWHYSLHRDFQNCYSTRRSPTGFFSSNSSSNSTRVPIHPHTTYTCTLQVHPENSPSRNPILHAEDKELFDYYSTVSRNSTHRRQGDLLEMYPCVLQDLPVTFQAFQPQVLTKATPVTPIAPKTFRTFQSFMTFQPFQAILQVLQVPVSPGIPPHSSILRLECIFYNFYRSYSSIGFHRNSTEYQLGNYNTNYKHYRHYILQRKGDVVISVNFVSVKIDVKMTYFLE